MADARRYNDLKGDWHSRHALRIGRELARSSGVPFAELFEDTLEGDLARFTVLRKLRRSYPDWSAADREHAITAALTP